MTICRSSWMVALVAGALSAPVALVAQQDTTATQPPPATEPRTHLVRTGDTLWEIARLYLGDPFLWPEIYRVNTAVIEDPHWIFPGESLAIPDGFGTPTVVAEAPDTVPQTEQPAQQQPSLIFAPVNRGTDGPTVFSQRVERRTGQNTFQGAPETPRTAVRLGEFRAAPWVDRNGGPRGHGRIVASTEMPGIAGASDKVRYAYNERLYILPPDRISAQVGDRYLTYRVGPQIHGLGQVMIPTGIVRIEEAYEGDRVASVARLVAQYDMVMEGDGVMPLEPFDMDSTSRVAAADIGVSGRVVWIQGEPVLPTLQRYLVVDASARDGVRLGDQLTLVRPTTEITGGVTLPEQEIAIAQVVRVTDFGITAIILDHTQPPIKPGTLARVTGRLP